MKWWVVLPLALAVPAMAASQERCPRICTAAEAAVDLCGQVSPYRRAIDEYNRATGAQGEDRIRLFEHAATMLVHEVDCNPGHPQAPLALAMAAGALEHTSRFASAARINQRIINELGQQNDPDPTRQAFLDDVVSNAYFRLAFSSLHADDPDRALTAYRVLLDTPRFRDSHERNIAIRREDAMVNVAQILVYEGRYSEASTYYQRLAAQTHDAETRRLADYNVAEMSYRQQDWRDAARGMQAFIDRYRRVTTPGAGDLLVQAEARIAEARRNLHDERGLARALADTVATYDRVSHAPGSPAAEFAANAAVALVDVDARGLAQLPDARRAARLDALIARYDAVATYARPDATIAALVRIARLQEENPDPSAAAAAACLPIQRYVLALNTARAASVDGPDVRYAATRVASVGSEEVERCVPAATMVVTGLSTLGDLAPPGEPLAVRAEISPLPLAPDDP